MGRAQDEVSPSAAGAVGEQLTIFVISIYVIVGKAWLVPPPQLCPSHTSPCLALALYPYMRSFFPGLCIPVLLACTYASLEYAAFTCTHPELHTFHSCSLSVLAVGVQSQLLSQIK